MSLKPIALLAMLFSILVFGATETRFSQAQQATSGQFWVRIFEDRNGNGVRDAGEPFLTRGAGADLISPNGVIIATALLDDSPNAASGQIGFQSLTPGEYTLVITAPDLIPTTPERFTRAINAGGIPLTVEFGGRRIAPNDLDPFALIPITAETTTVQRGLFGLPIYLGAPGQVARAALALLGALTVGFLTSLIGWILLGGMRRRHRAAMRQLGLTTTGSMKRVSSTGSMPVVSTGSMRPVTFEPPPKAPRR